MATNAYKRLLNMLDEQVGEATRGVVEYTEDDFHLLYIRPDLQTAAFRQRAQKALNRARRRPSLLDGDDGLGDCRADVEVYEEMIAVHLQETAEHGLIVSMEPEIARQLTSLLQECSETLH